jgi:hypothetical protein
MNCQYKVNTVKASEALLHATGAALAKFSSKRVFNKDRSMTFDPKFSFNTT